MRSGVFGIAIVICVVVVSFGYSRLPFFPQGLAYEAFFTDTGGITGGSDVEVSGITVGKVSSVALVGDTAQISFTMRRGIQVGDQSLAAVKTDTVLGQKSLEITPAGGGRTTTIPVSRTTTAYTLNNALQDLGEDSTALDKEKFNDALGVLTQALNDATPQLRAALDGVTDLSRTLNGRDEAIAQLLARAQSVSAVFARRADQVNRLVLDGDALFAALDDRRQALDSLITGIRAVSQQISGLMTDNRKQIEPTIAKLNLVVDNLNIHRDYITEALKRLPPFATALGEVVGSGPGFNVNIQGLPPVGITEPLFDAVFQPNKLPASIADFLRGLLSQRLVIRPKSP